MFKIFLKGPPSLLLEKQNDENTGSQRFTLKIQSFPAPCFIQWSAKVNDDDIFTPIDMNTEEYKGTTKHLPSPVLVVNQGNQLEKDAFKIEVKSFVGSTIEIFSGKKHVCLHECSTYKFTENSLYIYSMHNGLSCFILFFKFFNINKLFSF